MIQSSPSRAALWDTVVLAFVSLSLLIPALGQIPFRRAEIYFADAARTMVETGDWLVPHFQGAPFFDKPALTYWLMAGSFSEFGFSTASARIPSVLATLAVVLLTLWLGRMLWPGLTGLAGGLVLAATPTFMTFGRLGMSDALLTLWSTLAVALVVSIYRGDRTSIKVVLLGAVLGLGFLTKGPIAWITPGLGIACFALSHRGRRPVVRVGAVLVAASATLLIGFAWFAAVYLRMGWEPLNHFFFKENLARFSGASYNVGNPIWFLPQTYLHEGAPWSIFLPVAAFFLVWRQRDREARWLLAWIVLDTALLSVSRGKLGYYLLPLYPAASLLVARYFLTVAWGELAKAFARIVLIVAALILGALPFAVLQAPFPWRPGGAVLAAVIGALGAAALACAVAAIRAKPARTFGVLIAVSIVVFIVAECVILPVFFAAQPNAAIAEIARRERMREPHLRVAAHQDPVGLSRELLFDARLDLAPLSDLRAPELGAPFLLIVGPDQAGIEVLSAYDAIPGYRKVGEYPYIPPGIFSVRGALHGVEPKTLELLSNFSD